MCYSVTRCYSTVWLRLHVHEDVLHVVTQQYGSGCMYVSVVFAGMHIQKDQSRLQTSSGACITSSITCAILKAVHAGVGFESGTETTGLDVFECHSFPKPVFIDSCPSDIKETSPTV